MSRGKCLLCLSHSQPVRPWELVWATECAESLHELLKLEVFSKEFLENADYCGHCKEIIRDVNFMMKSVSVLERRLSASRRRITSMLKTNFEKWIAAWENDNPSPLASAPSPSPASMELINSLSSSTVATQHKDDTEPIKLEAVSLAELPLGQDLASGVPDILRSSSVISSSKNPEANINISLIHSRRRSVDQEPKDIQVECKAKKRRRCQESPDEDDVPDVGSVEQAEVTSDPPKTRFSARLRTRTPRATTPLSDSADGNSEDFLPSGDSSSEEDYDDSWADQKRAMSKSIRRSYCHPPKFAPDQEKEKQPLEPYTSFDWSKYEHSLNVSNSEVSRSASKYTVNGKFWTWDTVALEKGGGYTEIPETFESTFFFLFGLRLEESEKELSYCCIELGCPRRFIDLPKLRKHLQDVHGRLYNPYCFECHICNVKTPSAQRLDAHMSRMHDGDAQPYLCVVQLCDARYRTQRDLTAHMAKQHPEVPYENDKEGMTFDYRDKAVMGIRMQRPNRSLHRRRTIRCQEEGCLYRNVEPKMMEFHRRQVHLGEALPFACEQCPSKYKNRSSYTAHLNYVHKNKEEWVCEFCGLHFRRGHLLSQHLRDRHRDLVTEYPCKVCGRTYFRLEETEAHELLHTEKTKFRCVLNCTQRHQESLEDLRNHVKNFHEGGRKTVVCEICGKATKGPAALTLMKAHMVCHTKEKTWKCKHCEKIFLNPSQLKSHEEIHHADIVKKEYKCKVCPEVFSVYQYYYRHVRNKHGKPMPPFRKKK